MPDEAAFIQTIREHPDDDGPRLVYADWLEERGECERAEFIRVQIELARGVKDRARREQLTEREQALYKKPIIRWVRKNIRWVDTFLFHRGTLSHVLVKALDYLRHGQELFDLAPIMEISLRNLNGHVRELARAPTLQLLRTLDLCANSLQPNDVSTILASPYLESLRELDLRANRLGNPGARVVLSTQSLCRLERLLLANNGIAGGDWVIPRSPLRNLIELDLEMNDIADSGVLALVRSPISKRLQHLNLANCLITREGASSLASARNLPHLTRLNLRGNEIDDTGAESLANSSLLSGIEELWLSRANIGWRGAKALAQSQLMAGLRLLDLAGNRLNSRQQNRLELRFGSRVKF